MPYHIHTMGIYLLIEANNGLILIWDKKTSIFIKLSPKFKVSEYGCIMLFPNSSYNVHIHNKVNETNLLSP